MHIKDSKLITPTFYTLMSIRFICLKLALLSFLVALIPEIQAQTPRLTNLSTLSQVGTGTGIMTSGFVIGPGSGDQVVIRAVGPTLAASPFNMSGVLADPVLSLYNSSNTLLATNSSWKATDAATITASGAFSLLSNSKDAAIVTTLAPGNYTFQVAGAAADVGKAIVEVYEVNATTSSSRLLNLSTRLTLAANATATSGLTISPGTSNRTVIIRGVGPTLGSFGVSGALANPNISVLNSSGATIATNDDWGTPIGSGAATVAQLTAAFTQAGAFQLVTGSKDSALLLTLAPGAYTIQLTGNGGSGSAMIEVYDITPASVSSTTVSIAVTQATASAPSSNGLFTVTRTGDTSQPLTVPYSLTGTATSGVDYQALSGTVTIPAGSTTATIQVTPISTLVTGSKTVIATLPTSGIYTIGNSSATVTINNVAPTLYVADLRPSGSASNSIASGTATIYLQPDGSSAIVNVSFSDLSSPEQAPHLTLGIPGPGNNFVLNLTYPGQVINQTWTISATGTFSASDILNALKSGNIYVEIGSQNYPTGELTGVFQQSSGSQTFTAPANPPAVDLTNVTPNAVSRFLTQATFGTTQSDITAVQSQGYANWISSQMALPATSHLAATRADAAMFPNTGLYPITQNNRQAAWWKIATTSPDQLRQRVAFALSEIFVVSDVASALVQQPEALANYYDTLAKDAFGNFRQLLQDVTLSPVMGNYLNMLRNAAAVPSKGTSADENYAREIMQLFTIGLNYLNPDGSLVLDQTGQPIPTYSNTTIIQTANVLTGWAYNSTSSSPSFTGSSADWYNPMMVYSTYHDVTQKTLFSITPSSPPIVVPANGTAAADLKILLDALVNHQNTGPFIVKRLIQRLVTSNPSPGYVYRVSQVFANDGTGTRGNLAAVVKAILLDYEARSPAMLSTSSYGKLKEPLLRQTALYRAFSAQAVDGRIPVFTPDSTLGQAALRSPTVFNYFLPNYTPPGSLAAAGLLAPEFQITTDTTALTVPNAFYNIIFTSTTPSVSTPVLNLTALTSAPDNATLVATLNTLLCGGNMSTQATNRILTALAALPSTATAKDRAQTALYLVITTQQSAVQQ